MGQVSQVLSFPPRQQFGVRCVSLDLKAGNLSLGEAVALRDGMQVCFTSRWDPDISFGSLKPHLRGKSLGTKCRRVDMLSQPRMTLLVLLDWPVYINHTKERTQRVDRILIYFVNNCASFWTAADGPDT